MPPSSTTTRDLTQDAIGKRLGVSRFKVGRLLDRALREQAVRIEIVHPAARLVALEDALVERFGLTDAVVVDVPDTDDEQLARERVADAAADLLAAIAPSGVIGVSWGRTMIELAGRLQPGWTSADQIVQLNGAISRSARAHALPGGRRALRRHHRCRHPAHARAGHRGHAGAARCARSGPLGRRAAEGRPSRRQRRLRHGRHGRRSRSTWPRATSIQRDLRRLQTAGAVGDVLGRFITIDGKIALPSLDERTVGLPLAELCGKRTVGLAAGPGRGPVALGALRAALHEDLRHRRGHRQLGARA